MIMGIMGIPTAIATVINTVINTGITTTGMRVIATSTVPLTQKLPPRNRDFGR
jgi:hypothetical protein